MFPEPLPHTLPSPFPLPPSIPSITSTHEPQPRLLRTPRGRRAREAPHAPASLPRGGNLSLPLAPPSRIPIPTRTAHREDQGRAQGRRGALLSRGATIARRRFEPNRARGGGGHAGGAARAACCISLLPLLPGTPDGRMFIRSGRRRPRGTRSARGPQRPTGSTRVRRAGWRSPGEKWTCR